MARKYYVLIEKVPGDTWTHVFGDYSRSVVNQERIDTRDSGSFVRGTKHSIITTNGTDADMLRILAELNATK